LRYNVVSKSGMGVKIETGIGPGFRSRVLEAGLVRESTVRGGLEIVARARAVAGFVGLLVCLLGFCVGSVSAGASEGPVMAGVAADSGEGLEVGQWRTVRMRVTAYCPCAKCCGEYSDGVTACGHRIGPGDVFVAADKRYAFGTEMIIDGYGGGEPVKVLDRGGAIQGNRLDVFFNTHKAALKWGVRQIEVKIRVD
jgi:3D (Asp-Asp-Asp) domain-containing protein